MKRDDFEKIKQKINETKIENSSDKSILIEQFESTSNSKYSGLCLDNFVLNDTKRYSILFDEIMVILKKLTKLNINQKESIELFLVRLAKILSAKAENELINKVNSFEFNRIFYECVKNRIKNFTGSYMNQTSALVAFYEQVNRLLTNFQNETKSEEENDFEKNVTLMLNYTNTIVSIQNVSSSEIKLLKGICSKIDENMNCFEMVEFILFDLAIIQSSLFSLASKDKKDKEKQFNSIKEKQHVQSIDEILNKNNQIEKMMKNLDKADMFVSYIK
ncbi:hypothetical protein BpHYR1_037290 [Brachionus plicatilis]|uniref:Uncharacterized protein n=1 Tax=Brachionus plicatilis TaxID=10195 RepID=A0A3M7R8A1_BRAPC|nr:hypothetical protein BpHYR1_037290 [Brachionus plicatilis]